MLEKDFYTHVETPGYLNRVLYSDSVSENALIDVKQSFDDEIITLSFKEFWTELLADGFDVVKKDGKEYIYLNKQYEMISYNEKSKKLRLEFTEYIVRHYVEDELLKIETNNDGVILTKNHSLIDENIKSINPFDATHIMINKNDTLESEEIQNISKINYKGYVYDVSNPKTQMFFADNVLVHNTDSIFIKIPEKNVENKTAEELWEKAESTAESINELIIDYNKNTLLPRCNINPENNRTFFKTELLMSSMLLLSVKKNYAYKLLVKEGVVLDPPKISYTGIQVVKSNTAKFTQNILVTIIEDIMLNENIDNSEKINYISETVDKYYTQFKEDVNNFDFEKIGIPGKWSKNDQMINGMKLYNQIMNESIFSMGSAGKFIYCKFGINYGKNINGICVPYEYDKELLKEKFKAHKIMVDENKQWETLITTTCKRIFDLAKKLKS